MKKLIFVLLLVLVFACSEQGGSGGGSSGSSKNGVKSNTSDPNLICDKTLQVLPIEEPITKKIMKNIHFGRQLYAVYPARVNPDTAEHNYTYDGIYYAENTHDCIFSVNHNEIKYFDTIVEMAKKGIIVTPQMVVAKVKLTVTYRSANSNNLVLFVRAKGSVDEWKQINLYDENSSNYIFVETDVNGELEYYLEANSYFDWIDDEYAEPGYHYYGHIGGNVEIEKIYLPFK